MTVPINPSKSPLKMQPLTLRPPFSLAQEMQTIIEGIDEEMIDAINGSEVHLESP